jgi:hypothetical protein
MLVVGCSVVRAYTWPEPQAICTLIAVYHGVRERGGPMRLPKQVWEKIQIPNRSKTHGAVPKLTRGGGRH